MIPDQLLSVKNDVAAGKRRWAKIKTLLSWFEKKGRGKHVVQTIQGALDKTRLYTKPAFTSGSVHDYIEFRSWAETTDSSAGSTGSGETENDTKSTGQDQAESDEGDQGGGPRLSQSTGSKFCIGMLEAANRPNEVLTITRDKTVAEATTLMMTHRFSQLPVRRTCAGLTA